MSDVVHPTHEDPLARSASEAIGGPTGRHHAPHPFWLPVRVVLAVLAVTLVVGMAQKTPCVNAHWQGDKLRYSKMCYSDVPYLYTDRGFAARFVPYTDNGGRYPALEYPVLIGYFAYGAAVLTQGLSSHPVDVAARQRVEGSVIYGERWVPQESWSYFKVTAVLLAAFALLAGWFMAGVHRNRPWDAMLFAASPALALSAFINWDLLAVTAVAGALWAWSRDRPLVAGLFIGLGTATKLYPLFLLGALLVACVRRGRLPAFGLALLGAALAWLMVNLPPMTADFEYWKAFWTFNDKRGADLGSLWLVWQQGGHTVTPGLINTVSWVFFGAVCVGVLVLGLRARRTPRVPQLAFLVVVGFLVVNKVYSPQYVLWLLPLAVLARPRWRDVLIWTAGEVFYFAAVWLYLGGYTASASSGQPDRFYWFAIMVRVAAELYFAVVVMRDIVLPHHDPVRADGLTDDPAMAWADQRNLGTKDPCAP